MPAHWDASHTVDFQAAASQPKAVAVFLIAKAVEPVVPFETRITRFLTGLHPAEEGLIGFIDIGGHDLQHMAVNLLRLGEGSFVMLDLPKLLFFSDAALFEFVSVFAFAHAHIVEMAGHVQNEAQILGLRLAGVQAVFEGFERCVRISHASVPN